MDVSNSKKEVFRTMRRRSKERIFSFFQVKVENVGDGDTKKMGAGGGDKKNEDGNGNGIGNGGHSSIIWGIWESVKDFF